MKTNINKETKNKRKNNIKKVLGSSLALLVLLTGVCATSGLMGTDSEVSEEAEVKHGIKLNAVKKVENADGSVTQTISYEIQPSGATDKSVNVKVFDFDNKQVSTTDVIEVSVNNRKQEISVTVKQAFNKKYYVNVYSNYDSNIYSTIAIDYEKKLLSIDEGEYLEITNSYVLSVDKFFIPEYSIFTLDKTYTFDITDVFVVIGDTISYPFKDNTNSVLEDLLEASILDGTALTDNELWTALDSKGYSEEEINDWHSFLYETDVSVEFDVNYTIKCNETGLTEEYDGSGNLVLDRNYTGLVVGVNGLELETDGLVF